jgi:uncharacterized coiled-coil protein SlyX
MRKLVMVMTEHSCLHEEQIIGQSRAIERLDAELTYKKERLDDLKEDNRRMEKKIDTMNSSLNKFINKSDTKDSELNTRLTIIETRLDEQDKTIKANEQQSRDKYMKLAGIVGVIGLIVAFMNFVLPWIR